MGSPQATDLSQRIAAYLVFPCKIKQKEPKKISPNIFLPLCIRLMTKRLLIVDMILISYCLAIVDWSLLDQ